MTWGRPKDKPNQLKSGMLPDIEQVLFAYGSLKYERKEKVRVAMVRGQLRQTPDGFAAARFDMPGLVHGVLIRVTGDDLRRYDQREVGYQRIKVTTTDGDVAWAYHYQKPGFPQLTWIRSGEWKNARKEKAKKNAESAR